MLYPRSYWKPSCGSAGRTHVRRQSQEIKSYAGFLISVNAPRSSQCAHAHTQGCNDNFSCNCLSLEYSSLSPFWHLLLFILHISVLMSLPQKSLLISLTRSNLCFISFYITTYFMYLSQQHYYIYFYDYLIIASLLYQNASSLRLEILSVLYIAILPGLVNIYFLNE